MRLDRTVRTLLRALGVRSRHVDAGAAHLHVYDAPGRGRLPPIVLLPGLSDSAAAAAPHLRGRRRPSRRVVIVEGAGHGLSGQAAGDYTSDVHLASVTAVLDQLLDEPAVIVGNSLGGAAAVQYALDRPARVLGLFLTSPGGARYDDAALDALRGAFDFRSVDDAQAFVGRVVHRRLPLERAMARMMYARSRSPGIADILRTATRDHAFTPEQLATITAPIRLIWGRSERLLPAAGLAFWKASLPPHALVLEPDGFGHCPHLDDPVRLTRMIASFSRLVAAR
jgi:pimeloyl-ACP methyl ester carboxylesterase